MRLIQTLIFSFCLHSAAQKADYKLYQFEGNDSLNGHISKIVKSDLNGLVIYEEFIDYKISKSTWISDHIEENYYKDTLLVKKILTHRNSENKSVTAYSYNSKNQLISEKQKTFEKRLKKKRNGDVCSIEDSDFTKAKWQLVSNVLYTYNLEGKLIESYSPKVHWNSQNRYQYEYNNDGKIIKVVSLENDNVIWTEYRFIVSNGYDYCRIWYSDESNKNCDQKSSVRFVFDDHNRLIEKSEPDKTGIRGNVIEKYFYNSFGLLVKKQHFNTKGELEVTHIYQR